MRSQSFRAVLIGLLFFGCHYSTLNQRVKLLAGETEFGTIDRSPVDIAISADQTWAVTANQTSNSISLVDLKRGLVLDEVAAGRHPSAVVLAGDGATVLVSATYSGDVLMFRVRDRELDFSGQIEVGFEPLGLAVRGDGNTAYVATVATAQVAEIDLRSRQVTHRIDVGKWPKYLALSPDESRLAVGCNGDGAIAVIDTSEREMLYAQPLEYGINIGQLQASADGRYVYFPWMLYRSNAITTTNIRRGWILASRIARVRLDGPRIREAISLDRQGRAVADPHGLAISRDGHRVVCTSSGTHELLVYRLPDLPFVGSGGPGDLIDRRLLADPDLFSRIELGGRPLAVRFANDNRTVYVANYLLNAIQVVDIEDGEVTRSIDLGGPEQPSLERRGEAVFYDAENSLDQWYSCHSCHQDGGINSRPMDTLNDGTQFTLKTVLPLYGVGKSGPWTWHGWQEDLHDAMVKSLTVTMLGSTPDENKVEALLAFLNSLQPPPNPYRAADGSISTAAARGRKVFEGANAGCIECHHGPRFTDEQIHDVGLGSSEDRYQGFNTPSLVGVHRKVRLLHDGRRRTLEQVLTGPHNPAELIGGEGITEQQLSDLIEYLKSL